MNVLRRLAPRVAITLLPVLLALVHVLGGWQLPFLDRLDRFIYDVRLRATLPGTLDPPSSSSTSMTRACNGSGNGPGAATSWPGSPSRSWSASRPGCSGSTCCSSSPMPVSGLETLSQLTGPF